MALFCDNCGIVAVDDSTECPFCLAPLQWSGLTVEQLVANGYNPAHTIRSATINETSGRDVDSPVATETTPSRNHISNGESGVTIHDDDILNQLRAGFSSTYGSVSNGESDDHAIPPNTQPITYTPQMTSSSSTDTGSNWFPKVNAHERPSIGLGDTTPRVQPIVEHASQPDDVDSLVTQIEQMQHERERLDRQIDRQQRRQARSDFWNRNPWIIPAVVRLLAVAFVVYLIWLAIVFLYRNIDAIISTVITVLLVLWIVRELFRTILH